MTNFKKKVGSNQYKTLFRRIRPTKAEPEVKAKKRVKFMQWPWFLRFLVIIAVCWLFIYLAVLVKEWYDKLPVEPIVSPISENYTPGNSGSITASERKATTETVIHKYLEKKGSPAAMEATAFYEEATKNGIDPYLLVAIAGKESTWGKHSCGFNLFGWNRCKTEFESFRHSIAVVANKLATLPAYSEWRAEKSNIELLALTYNPDTPKEWSRGIKQFIEELREFEFKI